MMFVGTQFCPHCGARAVNLEQGAASSHLCPRCNVGLQHVDVAKTPLEECMRCGGLWIDVASFDHVCSDAETRQAASGLIIQHPADINPNIRYLKCPQCQDLMSRLNYAQRSGVVISVCRNHGIWLDRDQMRQIISFISSGGLDRARRAEEEESHEAAREQDSGFSDYGSNRISVEPFHNTFNSQEALQLMRGVASIANHFLGGK
jgi:Zn-finger nucleic acid-binding protein